MTHDDRIERLEQQRQELKNKIAAEMSRRNPDEVSVQRMKVLKCRLKDQIARLRSSAVASAVA